MERENNGPSKCRERWGGCARREPQGEDPEVRQLLERDGNAKHRAFIAWGLITALFIPDGWLPNATLAALVAPMITYLLPLLMGTNKPRSCRRRFAQQVNVRRWLSMPGKEKTIHWWILSS